MNKLEEIIIQEIKAKGPITFARFMEMALYYPELGYYTGPGTKIGAAGDFYTSPDVHPAFGHSVNFSALIRWGEQYGLASLGLLSQAKFLLKRGILELIQNAREEYSFDQGKLKTTLAIKKLIMPGGMGEVFKVLIQSKGFPETPRLRAFQ